MKKTILIIESDDSFIMQFEENLSRKWLDNIYEVKKILPLFTKGKDKLFLKCIADIKEFSEKNSVCSIFVDINISNIERDNTGIELGLKIRENFTQVPLYLITERNKNDYDFDTVCDATLEDFDGVFFKSYLLSGDFSQERLEKIIDKGTEKRKYFSVIEKEQFDVVIISVIPKEFEALNLVFKFKNNDTEPYKVINGIRFWKGEFIQNINQGLKLKVLYTMIGEAGNILSAVVSDLIFKSFNVKFAILYGIAASADITKAKIYSAVVSERIVYYELQKFYEEGKIKHRLSVSPEDGFTNRDVPHILSFTKDWKKEFENILSEIEIDFKDFENKNWIDEKWVENVSLSSGVIASGEKLLADSITISQLRELINVNKGVVAAEMEGYGFTNACRENRLKKWIMFRGISDYGGPEKSDEVNDKYQIIAALSSATLAKIYLKNIYIEEAELD
jgi:nucleoside phosphorylase